MNVENWNAAIDLLENLPEEKFDMSAWCMLGDHHCKTVGCIAGWITMSFSPEAHSLVGDADAYEDFVGSKSSEEARKFLGINGEQAFYLFMGDFSTKLREDITRGEALEYMKEVRDDPDHAFHSLD